MGPPSTPPDPRFHAKYEVQESGCWLWTAGAYPNGYAMFAPRHGDIRYAHRWSYERFVGPIPEGTELHHTCGVRRCVNPAHLMPLTRQQHRRTHRLARTHCRNGHPINEKTWYRNPKTGHAHCRVCDAAKHRRKRAERRTNTTPSDIEIIKRIIYPAELVG